MINLSEYPYLIYGMLSLGIVSLLYLFFPASRKFMLISGAALIPSGFSAGLFEESYWSPKRLFDLPCGIEDVLFCFTGGAMIAFLATVIFKININPYADKKVFFKRFLLFLTTSFLAFCVFRGFGTDVMTSTISVQVIVALTGFFVSKPAFTISLINAFIYTLYYSITLKLYFLLFPSFVNAWNGYALWKANIAELPAEELAWTFSFSVAWMLVMIYTLQIKTPE